MPTAFGVRGAGSDAEEHRPADALPVRSARDAGDRPLPSGSSPVVRPTPLSALGPATTVDGAHRAAAR
ncbi:hypothetical protein [Streptomyces sp. GESEQ-35]|uniref:hypothetical protein n=1 Tax=Streptomyces sp. GESEQ-35 TaxID=2812657 RepID=UPI001B342BC3|nr:hypothetical protein [Streptomyces sp. GESEQ-35]